MIALDLSRLLSRAGRGTPTGIDRVELAYAQHLIAAGNATCFAALTVFGGIGLLPSRPAKAFVAAIDAASGRIRWLSRYPRQSSAAAGRGFGEAGLQYIRAASPPALNRGRLYLLPQDQAGTGYLETWSGSQPVVRR